MTFWVDQGPVARPALGFFPTRASEGAAARIGSRRQIGSGPRSIIVTSPTRFSPRRIAHAPPRKTPIVKKTTFLLTTVLALFLSLAALGIGAAVDTPRTLMSRADYSAGRKAIEAETRASFARCRSQSGADRDVCKAEVRAGERVKVADLQARYHGTVAAAEDARIVRVKASFDLAKARCGTQAADTKADCLKAAREDRARALAQARQATT
jgi:hypothetical protein